MRKKTNINNTNNRNNNANSTLYTNEYEQMPGVREINLNNSIESAESSSSMSPSLAEFEFSSPIRAFRIHTNSFKVMNSTFKDDFSNENDESIKDINKKMTDEKVAKFLNNLKTNSKKEQETKTRTSRRTTSCFTYKFILDPFFSLFSKCIFSLKNSNNNDRKKEIVLHFYYFLSMFILVFFFISIALSAFFLLVFYLPNLKLDSKYILIVF
jgi:hypothetical protein